MQKKKFSLMEAIANTMIGYFTTLACSPYIYSFCGIPYKNGQLWEVVGLFTVLSVIRGYLLRRIFTKRTENDISKVTESDYNEWTEEEKTKFMREHFH